MPVLSYQEFMQQFDQRLSPVEREHLRDIIVENFISSLPKDIAVTLASLDKNTLAGALTKSYTVFAQASIEVGIQRYKSYLESQQFWGGVRNLEVEKGGDNE